MRWFGTGSRWAWLALCAACVSGCANLQSSGIDPTGQHIFASPPLQSPAQFQPYPGGPLPWEATELILTPTRTIAPVGSDVVLLAGVRGRDNYLRTNERVDWLIEPGGVGEIVDYDPGTWADLLFGDFTWPRRVTPNWAITSTSRRYLRLNRETPVPTDDVNVLAGQTWVTVTSPIEGTSYVTAVAPDVYGWPVRKRTATIYWVDAQWSFPAPAITSAGGKQVLTTTVTRHSDHGPCVGWRVRYEIAGGPAAGFSPENGPTIDVVTNEVGQASAEIVQLHPAAGTNRVNIQVIRPEAPGSCAQQLPLGCGSTMVTWSAADLAVRKTGPASVGAGAEVTYRIEVVNPGDLPADGVSVTDDIPAGFELLGTNPSAERGGQRLRWPIGRLDPRQTRSMEVRLRAGGQGSVTSCAEATSAGGLTARDCATTTVGAATLDLRVLGPTTARVGDRVSFEIVVTNRGQVPATGLLIKDRFGEGLEHEAATSPIEKDLENLSPGQSTRIGVTFRTTRSGSLCHDVEVTGDGSVRVSGRGCVNVAPAASPTTPAPAGPAGVSVHKTGPSVADVGQVAEFAIVVRNTGGVALTNLKVIDAYDPRFLPIKASAGYQRGPNELSWALGTLAPGESVKFEVHCRTLGDSVRACNRVRVTTAEGVEAKDEFCLEIRGASTAAPTTPNPTQPGPPGTGLSLTVSDFRDQVALGKRTTYEIRVTNNANESDRNVVLEVAVPPEMSPLQIGTEGPTRYVIEGQKIHFEPIAEIRPNETRDYRVQVEARSAGKVRLRARVTSTRMPEGKEAEEDTEIFAE